MVVHICMCMNVYMLWCWLAWLKEYSKRYWALREGDEARISSTTRCLPGEYRIERMLVVSGSMAVSHKSFH